MLCCRVSGEGGDGGVGVGCVGVIAMLCLVGVGLIVIPCLEIVPTAL